MAKKYNLSIITSIHQPNLEILMTFDLLYVLAKGGLCIYSGRPQDLKQHLSICGVTCNEFQIPIEILLKIGAAGCNDRTVITLFEKTNDELNQYNERLSQELKHCPNGIPVRTKSVSFIEMWYLLVRNIIFMVRYNWFQLFLQYMMYLGAGSYFLLHFDFDLDKSTSCELKVSESCFVSLESLEDKRIPQSCAIFLVDTFTLVLVLVIFTSSLSFSLNLKIIEKEFKNCK